MNYGLLALIQIGGITDFSPLTLEISKIPSYLFSLSRTRKLKKEKYVLNKLNSNETKLSKLRQKLSKNFHFHIKMKFKT